MAMPRDELHELSRELVEMRDEVRGLADEIQLKIHLAGMDAKDAWRKLEPKLYDFEKRAAHAAQVTAAEVRDLAHDLTASLRRIRDSL